MNLSHCTEHVIVMCPYFRNFSSLCNSAFYLYNTVVTYQENKNKILSSDIKTRYNVVV